VAWVIGDKNEVVLLLKAAKLLDKDGRFSGYLDGVQRLLRARAELRDGGCDTAVRICQTLDRDTRPGDPLKVLALELHADAFRSMGDTDREQKVLEDWEYLLRAMPNGPCDLAAGTEQSPSTFPGILGGSRSEEILQHYSRLAFLYERNRDTREYAKGIYIKFLNTAYHKWIDPGMRDKGSIEQRLAGLVSAGNRPAGDGKHRLGLSIIEPDRMYGKVSDKALEEMLEELSSMPAANYYAIVVGQVDMKERQFRIHEPLGTPLSQLLKEMQLIIDEGDQALSTFQPENISVVWKGQPAEWIVLSHKESAADIRSLSFGLRADKVGEQIDLALYILYAYRPPLNPDSKNELSGLLKKKPGDLAGYNALQGIAMELVKRTAKRVDQKAGRADGSRHQKGPIPL
jgi:hypothetical protein